MGGFAEILVHIDVILGAVLLIVSGVAVLVKFTPTPKDDEVVGKLQKFLLQIKAIFTIKR